MAEEPENLHFGDNDDDNDTGSVFDDEIRCTKLQLPDNIVSYIERQELSREVEKVACDNTLVEKITTNYVIAKKIISNLSWQDKMLCKHVCSMWHSVVHSLQKEQLYPADYVINLRISSIRHGIKFTKSSNFNTEPLVIFTFSNTSGFAITSKCEVLVPSPCDPACEKEHYLIDLIQQQVAAPKNCMLTVKASYLSYLPLPHSITSEHIITRQLMFARSNPFIGGVYIPVIPGVEFLCINIKSVGNMKREFYDVVDQLAQDRIVKGVLVYVTESFLLHTVEDIVFLNYFKDVQPNIPYALGGCIVEDTVCDQADINQIVDGLNEGKDFISENLVTMGLFTVPKTTDSRPENNNNFDAYSLIIESSDWTKVKIQTTINEFSKKVPHFEHSVVLKLSCVGRDQKHELEQNCFREVFPNTRLVGCYGNGELGVNHPARPDPEEMVNAAKRHRRDPGPQFGIMYSYSTVFVYIGWGKIISHPEAI